MMASFIIKEETRTIRHLECAFDTVSYQGLTLFTPSDTQKDGFARLLLNVTYVMALH